MKILMFADLVGPGGTERAFRVLVDELLRDNHHVMLITSRAAPGYSYVEVPEAFRDNPFPLVSRRVRQQIETVLADGAFDVIVYGLMFNYGIVRLVKSYGVPTVRYLHVASTVCPNNQKYRFGDRKVCSEPFGIHCVIQRKSRGCDFDGGMKQYSLLGFVRSLMTNYVARYWDTRLDMVIANSEYTRSLYRESGYPNEKLALSYPPNRFLGALQQNMPKREMSVVLFAGRILETKGLAELKQLLACLPEGVQLRVAGVGSGTEELERFATEHGLSHKLLLLGFIEDEELTKHIQSATVCVMPSHLPETYGLSGVEAIALGTPVVAYDVGGISEWLQRRTLGRLITPESPDKFLEAVLEVLSAPWRVQRMMSYGGSARRYVSDFYDCVWLVTGTGGENSCELSAAHVRPN